VPQHEKPGRVTEQVLLSLIPSASMLFFLSSVISISFLTTLSTVHSPFLSLSSTQTLFATITPSPLHHLYFPVPISTTPISLTFSPHFPHSPHPNPNLAKTHLPRLLGLQTPYPSTQTFIDGINTLSMV
jgi:hypothetical protein